MKIFRGHIMTCLASVLALLLLNSSVDVHDDLLGEYAMGMENEIESLVELLLVSQNASWALPDAPEGQDEGKQLSALKMFYMAKDFPLAPVQWAPFVSHCKQEIPNFYQGIKLKPLTPPPLS